MADKIVTSPLGKIAAGVKATEAARRGRKTPVLAHLVGRRATPESLKILLNDCRSRLSQLKAVRDAAATALADESAAIREHYQNEGYIIDENGAKTDILQDRRRVMIDNAIVRAKKAVYSAIESDVTRLMMQVREDEERVKSAREAWTSPVQVLMDMTLDSEKRRIYSDNLASAGQTGLANAAKRALNNNDLPLAAAVITAIDKLPKRSRDNLTVSKADVAEAVLNETYYANTDMLAIAEFVNAESHFAGREGLGRPRSSTDVIAIGLKRTSVEEELGRKLVPGDTVWLPVVGGVEQKHASKKEDKVLVDEAQKRTEDFVLFNNAVKDDRLDDALRIGEPYGWAEKINKGEGE